MNGAFENDTFRKAASEAARSHARDTGCTIVEALEYVTSNPFSFSLPTPDTASGVAEDGYEYTKRPDGSVWKRHRTQDAGWTRVKRPSRTSDGHSVGR